MLSSWFWIFVIVFGGALVVIGNIQYSISKESEDKQALAMEAKNILLPEVRENLALLTKIREFIPQKQISFETFKASAWETMSKGGLLRGLNSSDIRKTTHAYQLIYKANETHARIFDLSVGISSALVDAVSHKEMLMKNFAILLNELEKALKEIEQTETLAMPVQVEGGITNTSM